MNSRALPRVLDFFPHTRRGHGSMQKGTACVNDACILNHPGKKGFELHDNQDANVKDWKDEHGFREDAPLEDCHDRELAR